MTFLTVNPLIFLEIYTYDSGLSMNADNLDLLNLRSTILAVVIDLLNLHSTNASSQLELARTHTV